MVRPRMVQSRRRAQEAAAWLAPAQVEAAYWTVVAWPEAAPWTPKTVAPWLAAVAWTPKTAAPWLAALEAVASFVTSESSLFL